MLHLSTLIPKRLNYLALIGDRARCRREQATTDLHIMAKAASGIQSKEMNARRVHSLAPGSYSHRGSEGIHHELLAHPDHFGAALVEIQRSLIQRLITRPTASLSTRRICS